MKWAGTQTVFAWKLFSMEHAGKEKKHSLFLFTLARTERIIFSKFINSEAQ